MLVDLFSDWVLIWLMFVFDGCGLRVLRGFGCFDCFVWFDGGFTLLWFVWLVCFVVMFVVLRLCFDFVAWCFVGRLYFVVC